MTDHQLFEKVFGFLKQTIVYSNEEMARLDELKNLVRDRLAQPVHASDMSEKHVHISDKDRHEFECPRCGHCCRDGLERLCRIMGTFDLATGHADTMEQALDALESELRDVLGHLRARREWVGLTDEEIDTWNIVGHESLRDFVRAIEAKLKEKNNG